MMFTEVLMKDLARMLIHVRKIQNCKYLSRYCCQCASLLLNWNCALCDQVNLRISLAEKTTRAVGKVILIQVSFLTFGSKQK